MGARLDRYRHIFQSSPDGILLVDGNGVIQEVNDQAVALFGWTHDELVGSSVDRLVPSHRRDRHAEHRADYAEDGHSRPMGIGLELRAVRRDGTEVPVEIGLAPVRGADGEEGLVVATVRDVTERMRLRDFGAAALRATEDERRRIALELHDDTAQHLAAILIQLRLAERGADPDTRQAIERARDDLMETSEGIRRIARGLRPPELDDAGLDPALRAHARTVREATGLDVSLEIEPLGDLDRDAQLVLYRIVQEALGNASRHAAAERAWVRAGTEGGRVVVEVRDDGVGFDVEAQRQGGIGMGLMGMLERAASVGGYVDIHSTHGVGTVVRAHLPVSLETSRV